jgi:uncharacterized protein
MRTFLALGVAVGCATAAHSQSVFDTKAQRTRSTASTAATAATAAREAMREQVNESTLFLVAGQLGGSYIEIAQDIAIVTSAGQRIRVLPIVGEAAVQNVRDTMFLRGIDLGLTTTLALNHFKATGEAGPGLERQLTYIAPLFHDTMQIVAVPGIETINDLKGKRVNLNNRNSGTAQFVPEYFKMWGIEVETYNMSQVDAVQKMRNSEIDATVCLCPMPIPAFTNVKPEWGFRLLEVPFVDKLSDSYLPSAIGHNDYPNLVQKDAKIDSVAATTVLVTLNASKGSTRYTRTAKFIEEFFGNFAEMQKPPRHPLWKTTNIAASVPGWTRFPAAQEWIDRNRALSASALQSSFQEFIAKQAPGAETASKERLYRDFLEWTAQRKLQN